MAAATSLFLFHSAKRKQNLWVFLNAILEKVPKNSPFEKDLQVMWAERALDFPLPETKWRERDNTEDAEVGAGE